MFGRWIPGLNKRRFWRFYFSVYPFSVCFDWEDISETLETVFQRLSKHLEFGLKYPSCESHFQLFGYPEETRFPVFDILHTTAVFDIMGQAQTSGNSFGKRVSMDWGLLELIAILPFPSHKNPWSFSCINRADIFGTLDTNVLWFLPFRVRRMKAVIEYLTGFTNDVSGIVGPE